MVIRQFTDTDKASIVLLWLKCGLVVPWNDPLLDIERKLAEHPELFLVADVDGKLAGTVMGGYDGHRGWINYLAVAPEHQGQGIGAQLMQTVEVRLLALGCPKINLQIRASNQRVINYYLGLGFKDDEVVSMGKRLIPDDHTDNV